MDPVYKKFYPLLDGDLAITLGADFFVGDEILKSEIPSPQNLTHNHNGIITLSYGAVQDYASMLRFHEGWIQFVPWFASPNGIESRRIGFHSPAFMSQAKNFSLWFGRHDEIEPFTFERSRHGFIYLDFMSKNPTFRPLYIKARNRKMEENEMPELISFVIEVSPLTQGEGIVLLDLKHVPNEELPPCLAGLSP